MLDWLTALALCNNFNCMLLYSSNIDWHWKFIVLKAPLKKICEFLRFSLFFKANVNLTLETEKALAFIKAMKRTFAWSDC